MHLALLNFGGPENFKEKALHLTIVTNEYRLGIVVKYSLLKNYCNSWQDLQAESSMLKLLPERICM